MSDKTTGCFVGDMSEYREGKESACGGVFHVVQFRWTQGGTAFVGKVVTATVCESHMDQFRALGEREGYRFTIQSFDGVPERQIGHEKEV